MLEVPLSQVLVVTFALQLVTSLGELQADAVVVISSQESSGGCDPPSHLVHNYNFYLVF